MSEGISAHARSSRAGTVSAAGWLACLALAWTPAVPAQLAPRLTAQMVVDELSAAQASLKPLAATAAQPPLLSVQRQLASMADTLRVSMGGRAAKPLERVGDGLRASILRGHAAASRVRAYVSVAGKCHGTDEIAMQTALLEGVALLATASDTAAAIPVIYAVETMQHQPLFAIHQGGRPLSFALIGTNFADLKCADPHVRATDPSGHALLTQPTLTGASNDRMELRWPDPASLPVGSVVFHVAAEHKAFLVGCSALPLASAVIQVLPIPRVEVTYRLDAACTGSHGLRLLGHGKLPALVGPTAMVSSRVDTGACAALQSYRLTATVTRSDGSHESVGPFTQSAQAAMTVGLPGDLSMSWRPEVQTLFVSSGAALCQGVH